MVLWCGLMPGTTCILVLRPLGRVSGVGQVQPLSVPSPGPPGKIYKLNWLLAAYAVLGASWERLYCDPIPATTLQGLGHLARVTGHAEDSHCLSGVYGTLRAIRTVCSAGGSQPLCGTATERCSVLGSSLVRWYLMESSG